MPTSTPDPPQKPRLPRLPLVLVTLLGGGLGLLGPRACHNYIHMAQYAKLTEATAFLEEVRAAQARYHESHGTYVGAPPRPAEETDGRPTDFGPTANTGWQALGIAGDDPLRCRYEIALVPGPAGPAGDYRATGRCDLDRDGEPALFEASPQQPARRLTPRGVF